MSALADWIKYKLLCLPVLASEHGEDVDNFIVYVHALMAALFVGWLAYFVYVLFRFRGSRNPKADYAGVKSHLSSYMEGGVAFVEAVLLLGFAVPLWAKIVSNPPTDPGTVEIYVLGKQFSWFGRYAGADGRFGRQDPARYDGSNFFGLDRQNDPAALDDVIVDGTFVVPVNQSIILHIGSLDVIHSFAVRSMRICQDATPGLSIATWFKPTRVGEYKITCAQLCGNGHSTMSGLLKVVSQEEYDLWLLEKSAAAARQGAAPALGFE